MSKFVIFAALVAATHGYNFVTRSASANLYYAYTRENPLQPATLTDAESIRNSPLSPALRTVIIVHGHGGTAFTSLNPLVKDSLLAAENVNVIVVDWSIYASLSYSTAVAIVPDVAEELATFIQLLTNTDNTVQLANLHLVGFNLGAHVVGITGRILNNAVARITGLDPSGSQWGSNSQRLKVTDAIYVEVIHTDGSGILANGLGVAIGNIDFFANGGSSQPGCFSHACCHERAYQLFAASQGNPNLVGFPCSSNLQLSLNLCRGLSVKMGGNELRKIGSGMYRVNTGRIFPY